MEGWVGFGVGVCFVLSILRVVNIIRSGVGFGCGFGIRSVCVSVLNFGKVSGIGGGSCGFVCVLLIWLCFGVSGIGSVFCFCLIVLIFLGVW